MKTVTSQNNLSGYFANGGRGQLDIDRLNRKIKSIKSALKVAQRHNEELHLKLRNLKESHQLQTITLESQYKKYKEMYQDLLEKYQLRSMELKEYRRRYKRLEIEQIKGGDPEEEALREFKETIYRQEKDYAQLKEENRLLYDQLLEKNTKIKEMQFHARNASAQKSDQKDKSFLLSLKTAIESKNEQFEKALQEKSRLAAAKQDLQKQYADLTLKITKVSTELDYERRIGKEIKQRCERYEKQAGKLAEENRTLLARYQQLLNFSYDAQRQFERQIQVLSKELSRRQSR